MTSTWYSYTWKLWIKKTINYKHSMRQVANKKINIIGVLLQSKNKFIYFTSMGKNMISFVFLYSMTCFTQPWAGGLKSLDDMETKTKRYHMPNPFEKKLFLSFFLFHFSISLIGR